jgi:hypothetical protein
MDAPIEGRFYFTPKAVEALPLLKEGEAWYRDAAVPALALRVDAAGGKTYFRAGVAVACNNQAAASLLV